MAAAAGCGPASARGMRSGPTGATLSFRIASAASCSQALLVVREAVVEELSCHLRGLSRAFARI
jgi:hypothetical protein